MRGACGPEAETRRTKAASGMEAAFVNGRRQRLRTAATPATALATTMAPARAASATSVKSNSPEASAASPVAGGRGVEPVCGCAVVVEGRRGRAAHQDPAPAVSREVEADGLIGEDCADVDHRACRGQLVDDGAP